MLSHSLHTRSDERYFKAKVSGRNLLPKKGGSLTIVRFKLLQTSSYIEFISHTFHLPRYSNLGFAVLGHALEEIYNTTWLNLLTKFILQPLGLDFTGVAFTPQVIVFSWLSGGFQFAIALCPCFSFHSHYKKGNFHT